MAYRRRNNNNTKSSFYERKANLSVPDFPQPPVEDTSRVVPQTQGITAETAYSKVRSYDAQLNKINVNYVGAAPIFGPNNPVQTYNLPGEVGLFTGSINNLYFHDKFNLLATINRNIKPHYHGMKIDSLYDLNYETQSQQWVQELSQTKYENKKLNKAFYAYTRNIGTLLAQLVSAQLTDLNFNHWHFDNDKIIKRNDKGEEIKDEWITRFWSGYDRVYGSAQQHMLISYQMNLVVLMITLLNFEYLTSQLPKLQELYKSKTNWFVYVQNQLKRSRFTAPVRQLLSWLKQRYIDTYFMKEIILPLSVVSKETDGLNSPLMYFTHIIDTPIQPIYFKLPGFERPENDASTTIMDGIASWTLEVDHDSRGRIYDVTGDGVVSEIPSHHNPNSTKYSFYLWRRECNTFQINTVLDIIMNKDNTDDEIKKQLEAWMREGLTKLESYVAETVDMSHQAWLIDIETALARLSENNSINWKQNVDFTSLPPVIKYSQYKLIDDLILFGGAPVVHKDEHGFEIPQTNGYQLALPIFRKTGLPETLMKEYAQAFYMESNTEFISFLSLGTEMRIRFRQKPEKEYSCIWSTVEMPGAPKNTEMPILRVPWKLSDETLDSYYTAIHQLDLPAIEYTKQDENDAQEARIQKLAPNWMATVVANFQNKSDEIMITLAKNFITPMA